MEKLEKEIVLENGTTQNLVLAILENGKTWTHLTGHTA